MKATPEVCVELLLILPSPEEVVELLQEAYALALRLVREQEPALRLATDRLVERRTLGKDELGVLLGPRPAKGAAPAAN